MVRRAFTLVELLVVIAVISVLAALLVPGLQDAFDSAQRASCMNNQRQLYIAMADYADCNAGAIAKYDTGRGGVLSDTVWETSYSGTPISILQQNSDAEWYRRVVNHGIWMEGGRINADPFFCPGVSFEDPGATRSMDAMKAAYSGPARELLVSGGRSGYSTAAIPVHNYVGYAFNTQLNPCTGWWGGGQMDSKNRGWRLQTARPSFPLLSDHRGWAGPAISSHAGKGFNVLYMDASVAFQNVSSIVDVGAPIWSTYATYYGTAAVLPIDPRDDRVFAGDANLMDTWKVTPRGDVRFIRYGKMVEAFCRLRQ